MPKPASTRSAYKMLTCIYLCRTLLFFAPYADFLKKKLSVQLSFQNPFWKRMKMENTTSDDTFFRREINYRTMRMLMVSVSYRFGTLKDAIKKVKRGISNDDMKSGGSGGGEQQM